MLCHSFLKFPTTHRDVHGGGLNDEQDMCVHWDKPLYNRAQMTS